MAASNFDASNFDTSNVMEKKNFGFQNVIMSRNEYDEYMQFQASKQLSPTKFTTTIVKTSNPTA